MFCHSSFAKIDLVLEYNFPTGAVVINEKEISDENVKNLTFNEVQQEVIEHPEKYTTMGVLFETCSYYNNDERVLQVLIDALKEPINEQQKYLNWIFKGAVINSNNVEVIKKLVGLGAEIEGDILLQALQRNPNLDIARYLIEAGADVKAKDKNGNTALIILTERMKDAPDIVQMLIDRGINVNAKNHDCCTAMGWTMACGLGKTYDLLVRAGVKASKMTADPNIPPLRNESCRRYCKNIYTSIRCLDEDDKTNVLDNRK